MIIQEKIEHVKKCRKINEVKILKKILFGITSLTLGGAERVLVDLANVLSKEDEVTILTLYPKGEFEKDVSNNVKQISLFSKSYQEMNKLEKIKVSLSLLLFKNRLYHKKVKKDYDVEIAFLEGPITRLFSVRNPNVKKIAWIHNDIRQVFGKKITANLKKQYDKKQYETYDNLIFVSQDNKEKFEQIYPNIQKEKLQVIYNYLDAEKVRNKAQTEIENLKKEGNLLVTVARLVEQKGIDRFINVHAQLQKKGIKNTVCVIGEGPEKEELEKQIKQYQVEDTFLLLGKKENPYPYMKQADYFCLLSYYEGYGMVLEEAKLLGKNIIITDTAAREAVQGYPNTTILENTQEGILQGLEQILQQPKLVETTNTNYTNQEILQQIKQVWEE